MSGLIERVVRINGEERQRSQVVTGYDELDRIVLPVGTVTPPLLESARIEVELIFDPPVCFRPAPASQPTDSGEGER